MLGMQVVERIDNYLGLPLYVGKNKTNAFRFLLDRIDNNIKGVLRGFSLEVARKSTPKPCYNLCLLTSFQYSCFPGASLIV